MELFGLLKTFPVADVLQWAANERATGVLVFRHSRSEKRIHLDDGQVVACFSSEPLEFFGRYLLANGQLQQGELLRAIAHCRKQKVRLGQGLVELDLLPREIVQAALRRQIEDSICDVFLWRQGLFYFAQEDLEREELLPQPIHTIGLVMEGTRWIDEHVLMRERLPNDDLTLRKGPAWPGEGLAPLGRHAAEAWARGGTLVDHYQRIGGSYFRFLEVMAQLVETGVFEVEGLGSQATDSAGDVPLIELLLEQAESEWHAVGGPLALPLTLLANHYPYLAGRPSGILPLRPAAEELRRGIDGETPLRDLLAPNLDQRAEQLEWLVRQLRRRKLALLPLPWSEMRGGGE
ncbi:MAG: DUF4388 domain-containing protein [Thermoanaerobaculia bacterium]